MSLRYQKAGDEDVRRCRYCGEKTKVYWSKPANGRFYRYRKCTSCHGRFVTVELYCRQKDEDGNIRKRSDE